MLCSFTSCLEFCINMIVTLSPGRISKIYTLHGVNSDDKQFHPKLIQIKKLPVAAGADRWQREDATEWFMLKESAFSPMNCLKSGFIFFCMWALHTCATNWMKEETPCQMSPTTYAEDICYVKLVGEFSVKVNGWIFIHMHSLPIASVPQD